MAVDITEYNKLKISELITSTIIESKNINVANVIPFLEKTFLPKYNLLRSIRKCLLLT